MLSRRPAGGPLTPVEIPTFLTAAQADLVRETEPARMDRLDEDALLELHTRVRRARSKYVTLCRRTGAARVGAKGARGHARPGNQANAAKAEVFELALARVSARRLQRSGVAPRLRGRGGLRRHGEHPASGDEDHRGAQARRLVTRPGGSPPGPEGLPLT